MRWREINLRRGMTLIEVAVVMAVSGVLMIALLKLSAMLLEQQRVETTKQHLEDLRQALTAYVSLHGRLPCPVSPLIDSAPAAEACASQDAAPPPGVIAAEIPSDNAEPGEKLPEVWIGIAPIQALRIGGSEGRDGWGNQITYAVSRRLTWPRGMRGNPLPPGDLSVVDQNGNNLLDKPDTGRYVLISHGPAGDGAWTEAGQRRPCRPGTLAARNCGDNGTFVEAPFSLLGGPAFYDHFLIHDDAFAGGDPVDPLAFCNSKKSFYKPLSPDADDDGCVPLTGWHGYCLQSFYNLKGKSLPNTWYGAPIPGSLTPATTLGGSCGCQQGLTQIYIGAWNDGRLPLTGWVNVVTPLFTGLNGKPVKGLATVQVGGDVMGTSLYTCTQPEVLNPNQIPGQISAPGAPR